MSMMGELKFFLGLQIRQQRNGIFISQEKYLKDCLKKFGMQDCKGYTPMPAKGQLGSNCRISGSSRPLRFELWGARGDCALYLSVSQRSNYRKNNTRDTEFILVRATDAV